MDSGILLVQDKTSVDHRLGNEKPRVPVSTLETALGTEGQRSVFKSVQISPD